MCLSVCCMYAGTHGGQKGALEPLEWELQTVVSCLMEVLGTELRILEEQLSALNGRSIPPSSMPPFNPTTTLFEVGSFVALGWP